MFQSLAKYVYPACVLAMDLSISFDRMAILVFLVILLVLLVWQAGIKVAARTRTVTPPPSTAHLLEPAEHITGRDMFKQFLEEAWPASGQKKGYAIRATKYEKIAATLRGRSVNAKFKNWVKKNEFFFLDTGEGTVIAVPAQKGQVPQSPPIRGSYKVVAQVEEFAEIIARYHNDITGHHGILRTHAEVSVLCMRMQ